MTPQDQQQGQISSVPGGAETVREQDKVMLILAYLGILSLIPFLTVKDSEYVKWHAKQGLAVAICGIPLAIVATIMNVIPFLGTLLGCVMWVGYFVVDIMAMLKGLKGERWRIPVVSSLADKF
jgi:uncharacterized membrane protein